MYRKIKVKRLKKALSIMAFISLIADIAISTVTLISLRIGESYTISILFVINYILTVIVAISLILIFCIAILSHSARILKILYFFRFWR